MRCTVKRSSKRRRTLSRDKCPSRSTAPIAPPTSSTMKPVMPSSTTSGAEPRLNAITGVPQAIASIMTRPNGSGQSIGTNNVIAPLKIGPPVGVRANSTGILMSDQSAVLEVRDLKKHFPIRKGLLQRASGTVFAVDGVSFTIQPGETLGLVGESGCGKTTVGRTVTRLIEPTAGSIRISGKDITNLSKKELRPYRREMQIIFQDPFSSLDPRMSAGDIVAEPLRVHKVVSGSAGGGEIGGLLWRAGFTDSA